MDASALSFNTNHSSEIRELNVFGKRLTYSEYGAAQGTALFFFHGWPGSSKQGVILDQAAKELGVRVISINRPGILGSDLVVGRSLKDWGPLVGEVANQLKLDRFSVLGVSGGGPYALACAWGLAERLDRVVVVSGAPLLRLVSDPNSLFWVYRYLIWLRSHSPFALNLLLNFIRLLLPLKIHRLGFYTIGRSLPERDRSALFEHKFIDEVCQSFEDHLGSGAEALISDAEIYLNDPGFDLKTIKKKVSFWHGELDRNIPIKVGRKMAAFVPDSEFLTSPTDGHYSLALLEAAKILRWMYDPNSARSS